MRSWSKRLLAALVAGLVVGIAMVALLRTLNDERTHMRIAQAGIADVEFILVGGSQVRTLEPASSRRRCWQYKVATCAGPVHWSGWPNRSRGAPIDCLGRTYDAPRYWTSTTPGTGEVKSRDAVSFELVGSITLSVVIVEVVLRPTAVDPVCQSIVGTYFGTDGALAGMEGTFSAGFLPGGTPQFSTFDEEDR